MSLLERWRPRSRTIDLGAAKVVRDPFPHYETLRQSGPVQFLPRHDFWIVLGHDEVRSAFERPHIFSNEPYADIDSVLLAADPPRQTAVRQIISRFFSAEALGRMEAAARRTAESLVRPELDVIGEYGAPVSRAVGAELIGFDASVLADIQRAAEETLTGSEGLADFIQRLDALADRGRLFEALRSEAGDLLGEAELRSLVRLLWLAATTTTERVIGRGALLLMKHGDIHRAVKADRALLAPFIEEVMRLHPPEHLLPRRATEAARLGGCDLPAGALVQLCVSAANRDPARYDDPAALRLDRSQRRHFAFGRGVHQCVGAPLARRVVAQALGTLVDHGLRQVQPLDGIDWFATMTALSPHRLTIGLDAPNA